MKLQPSNLISGQQRYKITDEVIIKELTSQQLEQEILTLQTELIQKQKILTMIKTNVMGII